MRAIFLLAWAVLLFAPGLTFAQDHGQHHGHHAAVTSVTESKLSPAAQALQKVNHDMHVAMDVPLSGPPSADFLRTMIPHHQGAIDMANVVIKYGQDEDVRALAERIARTQTWEINLMHRILARMGQKKPVQAAAGAMATSANTPAKKELLDIHNAMHAAMNVKLTDQPDCDFVRGMIPHHQGAVNMAYWVLGHGHNNDVNKLAREIIKAQGVEIAWMKNWLRDKDCK